MRVVSFTPRPLYPQGKSPYYPLDRRLGGHQSRLWTRWWLFPACAANRTPNHLGCSQRYTTWAIPAANKIITWTYNEDKHGLSVAIDEGRLQSSWSHLITPSRNFMEVRWRSLFWSTSLGKRCTSYNVPPTSRKRAADRLPQASGG
jgi:hypothetical protein